VLVGELADAGPDVSPDLQAKPIMNKILNNNPIEMYALDSFTQILLF